MIDIIRSSNRKTTKDFSKAYDIIFILVAVWALLATLCGVLEGVLGDSLMMYFVADIISNIVVIIPLVLAGRNGYTKTNEKNL